MRLIARLVTLILLPLDTFGRTWERKKLGERLIRVIVDIILLVHLISTFWPPHGHMPS